MRHNIFLIEVGKKIKHYRNLRKITLVQMGKDVGLSITALSFIENGKRDFRILNIKKIAERLDIDLKELL